VYTRTGVDDAATMLLWASETWLVQRMRRAYAAPNNENTATVSCNSLQLLNKISMIFLYGYLVATKSGRSQLLWYCC